MKNKRFIITCSILVLITTISLIITVLINSDKDKEIRMSDLVDKTFEYTFKDSFNESSEEISFDENVGKKKIKITNNSETINDINKESEFNYTVNNNIIYIKQADLTSTFKYKKDCIYDTDNPEIKYCLKKNA